MPISFENSDDLLMNSSIGIHFVSSEGVVLYANQHELDLLGYDREEYVGHHVSEFQLDGDGLDDLMSRLVANEPLKNYPARVRGKLGTKYMLYNSNVYREDGRFVHTRCFSTDIDVEVYDVMKATSKYFRPSS